MILDGVLAAAGDQDDVVDAGGDRLLDAVLDDRLVDERQHLFRLGLGGGKEPGPQTGGREHGFANGRHGRIVAGGGANIQWTGTMLDPIYVRDHIEEVRAGLRNRGLDPDRALEELATLETARRRLIPELEGLKRQQNTAGDEVARAKRMGKDTARSRKRTAPARSR